MSKQGQTAFLKAKISRQFDIALLRPSTLPKAERFETIDDVEMRRKMTVQRFRRIKGLRDIADRLQACSPKKPCAAVSCAVCGRLFRRWFVGQALSLAKSGEAAVLTVAIELVPCDDFESIDLVLLKKRVAQRLRRAAPSVLFIIGGIEAEFLFREEAFLIHAHLMLSSISKVEIKAVRQAFSKIARPHPVKFQNLKDPIRQLSYLVKFVTFHRPGRQTGPRRPKAIPLPDEAFKQLALWRARYELIDFVFVMGLRRKEAKFVRVEGSACR